MVIGTRIKIINAGRGALGCNGCTGVVTEDKAYDGLTQNTVGYNVRLDKGEVWRIHRNADVEILSGSVLLDEDGKIKNVIFNAPATIVLWTDGTKTVVKCQEGDTYDREKGLALCIAKKYLGNKGNFNEVFKKWIQGEPTEAKEKEDCSVEEMRLRLRAFCSNRLCSKCVLAKFNTNDSCNFISSYHGVYTMSDDKIREAYNIAFERKTEPSITLPTIPEDLKDSIRKDLARNEKPRGLKEG